MSTDTVGMREILTSLVRRAPLLHDDYPYARLMAAVTAVRLQRLQERGAIQDPANILRPLTAANSAPDEAIYIPVQGPDLDRISDVRRTAITTNASWQMPLELEVQYRFLPPDSKAISASNPAWPQVIFLARSALDSTAELTEQIIHEFCHQWQYLIEEVLPLEKPGESRAHVLPSGTAERGPREVLGAFHVGATLARHYKRLGDKSQMKSILDYVLECRRILQALHESLTDEGRLFFSAIEGEVL